MASMKYHKDCKRWRVFWHVTLPNGEVDKGSKSFKEKKEAQKFKELVEKKEKRLKRAVIVEVPCLDVAVEEWKKGWATKDGLNRFHLSIFIKVIVLNTSRLLLMPTMN